MSELRDLLDAELAHLRPKRMARDTAIEWERRKQYVLHNLERRINTYVVERLAQTIFKDPEDPPWQEP